MSVAYRLRLALAMAACVVVVVLALTWRSVPAVLGPCPYDPEQPYVLGTCIQEPTTIERILKLAGALLAIAAVAVLAARAAPKRKHIAGATAAALSGLVGLMTLQAISRQVFAVGYVPPVEAIGVVGGACFLLGAFVVWAIQKWRPHILPFGVGSVTYAWTAIGLGLATWAVSGLATQDHYEPVVWPWVIVLVFSILTVVAAVSFGRGAAYGSVLICVVSALALLYSASWLGRGGLDEALGDWPAIVLAVALSVYSLIVSRRTSAA